MQYRLMIPMAVLLSTVTLTVGADDYRVYSAAGELPEQRMARLAEAELAAQRESLGRMPPPLPKSSSAANVPSPQSQPARDEGAAEPAQQARDEGRSEPVQRQQEPEVASASPSAAPLPSSEDTPKPQVVPVMNQDFDEVMAESVTVDVQDMRWEDIVASIMPDGWRVRFQRVGDTILEQRADITITNASREEVLHALLSRAGLAFEPFPEFDEPLLIVSKQNGAQ